MTGHTFITHVCECIKDCGPVCPVECIHRGITAEGRSFSYIDESICIDCGACQAVCPIEGSVLHYWWNDDSALDGLTKSEKESQELRQRVQSVARFNSKSPARVQLWLSDCAARVTDIFEHYCPLDPSVRQAIRAARQRARIFDRYVELGRSGFDGEELESAHQYSWSCKEAALDAARDAANEPAQLAAKSAAAVCTREWFAASAAIDAIYALHRLASVSQARAAREREVHWQDRRLIARMLPGKIDDWPLPSAEDETFLKRFNDQNL